MTNKDDFIEWLAACPVKYLRQDDWYEAHEDAPSRTTTKQNESISRCKMKKSELKKILKPLVQECIKESLLEDGLISGIIAEVVKGMGTAQPIVEAAPDPVDPVKERMRRNAFTSEQSTKLKEHKEKLMSAIGGSSYNGVDLFEGTTPAP